MNVSRLADSFREKFPKLYKDKTDKEIIDDLRLEGFNVPSYEESIAKTVYKVPSKRANNLNDIDTNPSWVNNWFTTGDFIPERFKEKGFMGISPDFFKQSYIDSMAGKSFRAMTGSDKYEVSEDYDPAWYTQAAQFLTGMASPLEVGVMISTGMVGKVVSGVARTGLFGHGVANKFLKNGLLGSIASRYPKMGTVAQNTIDGALSMGIGGGGFSAAHALTEHVANQRMAVRDNEGRGVGDVNVNDAMKYAADEMLHSMPIFAIAGGVTQGMMGSLYGYAQSYMKNENFAKKMALAVGHPASRIGEEALLFTSLPSMLGHEDAPKMGTPDFWKALGQNTIIIGGMRAVGAFTEDKFFDAKKFLKNEMALESKIDGELAKSGKRILDDLPADAPVALRDMVRKNIIEGSNLKSVYKEADKALDTIIAMNKELENPDFVRNASILGTVENKKWGEYADLSAKYSYLFRGAINNVLESNGKPRIRESFIEYKGREPKNEGELLRFEKNLKGWRDNIKKSIDWMNKYENGDWANSDGTTSKGVTEAPSYEIRTVVGGEKRRVALEDWSDAEIKKYAKKAGFEEGVEYQVKDGVIQNKERIINRIFDVEKKRFQEQLELKRVGAPKMTIAQRGVVSPEQAKLTSINENLLIINQKTSPKIKSNINEINKAVLPIESKQLLAYSVQKSARDFQPIHTKTAIDVLKFSEKNYGKSIDKLSSNELKTLSRDYINDYFGKDIITSKFDRVNKGQLLKLYKGDRVKAGLVEGEFNLLLNNMKEHFHHGDMQKILNYDILSPKGDGVYGPGKIIKLFQKPGQKEITIPGGIQGIVKLAQFAKNQKEFKVGSKKISGEEVSILIDVANELFLRPEDIPLIKVVDINPSSKQITVRGKGEVKQTIPLSDKTFRNVQTLIKKKKLKSSDDLFKIVDVKELNLLMNDVYKKAPKNITPEIYDTYTGEYYSIDKTIKTPKMTLPSGKVLGGTAVTKGIKASSLFRRLAGLKGKSPEEIAAIMGHSRISTQKRYEKAGEPKPIKEKRAEREPSELVFTEGDKKARARFIEKWAKKDKVSNKAILEAKLGKGVLGEFIETGEGIIRLQEGIWQPADFFHERVHKLKAYARETNNKSLMKLIEKGESLARQTKQYKDWKKKNPNRDVEEFLSDIAGGKASLMEFPPSLLTKVTQFVKQIVSRVKKIFGVANFNDYANIVAGKVRKGFSMKGIEFAKGQIKYRMKQMNPKQSLKYVNDVFDQLFKEKLTDSQRKDMIRYIGELGQLGENFKLGKDTELSELQHFVGTISALDKNVIKNMPNKIEKFRLFRDAEKIRLIKNVNESDRTLLLKDLEVPDGNMFKATKRQLEDFIDIVNSKDDIVRSETQWIDERVAKGALNKEVADRFKRISKVKWATPIVTVLQSVGLKKLANLMRNHTAGELGHIGKFSDYEYKMKQMVGKRKWHKYKDMTYLFDKERYIERLEKGYLSNAEKQFIRDAIDTNTWEFKNTKEGMIGKEHKKLMDYYKNELIGENGILKQILNDAEYEKFMKDKNIKWLEKNIYVQRRLTREMKEYYRPDARAFEKLVEVQTEAVTKKLAKEYFGKKKYTEEEFNNKMIEFQEDANAIAFNELYEMFKFSPGKYSPSFLKKRHVKLPEKLLIDGKMIDVYETQFGLTTKDYAIGQAKFLANIEYFPEFVKIKGFNMKGERKLITEIYLKDKTLGDWVEKKVKDHLSIDREHTDYPEGIRLVRYTTSVMAKMQLSFPTSGLKNFVIGQTQSLLAFRLRDFFMGFIDVLNKDNRAMVRATGATEIGMRHFQLKGLKGRIDDIAEKGFFRFGLMRPTENLNRYSSVLIGKRDQAHLARRIQYSKEGSASYRRAETKLTDFYHLDAKEVALLKQFGMKGVKGVDPKIAGANRRAVENLYQKMNTYAHINTQGAAINLFMPDWAGSPLAQSALLYKRMAYHSTVNTIRNLNIARKNKSFLQPLMFGLGAYVSGNVMIQFYDKILGQSMPKENSNEWQTFKTIMWKGEFLGILSDFMNPWRDEGLGMTMYPAVLSTIGVTANSFMAMVKGEKFVGQGVHDILKGSSGLFNNTAKLYRQGLFSKDSYPSQSKKYRKFYYDMLEEYGDRDEIEVQNQFRLDFERSKYMQAFWNMFESGKNTDLMGNSLGKWYMMSLFAKTNDYYYRKIDEDGKPIISETDAFLKAVKSMKTSVTSMNPNKAKVNAKTLKGMAAQLPLSIQFIKWLDRDRNLSKGLAKLENQYGARVRLLNNSIIEYVKSNNLEADLKRHGISIANLIFK